MNTGQTKGEIEGAIRTAITKCKSAKGCLSSRSIATSRAGVDSAGQQAEENSVCAHYTVGFLQTWADVTITSGCSNRQALSFVKGER